MAKRMLADVLWEAANKHLSDAYGHYAGDVYRCEYSCCAVDEWIFQTIADFSERLDAYSAAHTFLKSLGCKTGSTTLTFDTRNIRERQQRRYMWLLLAAKVAEDEGIEV